MTQAGGVAGPPLDLTRCDQEPVHVPGTIQPHGVLFALDPTEHTVRCVSDNSERLLGHAPAELLGRGVATFLRCEGADLRELLRLENLEERNPIPLQLASGARFSGIAHRYDGRLILECEPEDPDADALRFYAYNRVRSSLVRLRNSRTLEELCERTATEVRLLTGFDRVLIYAFKPDWTGEVVAEACADDAPRYLGQRFPASDIPSQARALYTACRLRMIPRAAYTPAALVGSLDGRPLDLTHATLRSVSPIHREYMKNMGVTGSMGTSLMHQERLWGLITCNHESGERFIPYETRAACALIGEVASVLIAQRVSAGAAAERGAFLDVQAKLIQSVVHDRDVVRGLTERGSLLLDLIDSTGAALCYQKAVHTVGKTPSQEALAALVSWIEAQGSSTLVVDSLPARFAPAHGYKDVACGLLATAIDVEGSTVVEHRSWLLWFRPEVIQTIKWGADPNKPVTASSTGELHPRTSFDRWREEVSLQCVPWSETDRAAARSLAGALVDVILEIEASRLFKENALVLAAANRNLHHQMEANVRVEQILAARTEQLLQREMSLRVVLGAIDDGLVSVGLDGRLQPECSPAVEAWFGKLSGKTFVWDLLFASDPAGAREFEALFRQLAADTTPFEVAARPMCREIRRGDRRLELGFKPVRQGRSLVNILVTIKDITERS